jgi:hypothetical protein
MREWRSSHKTARWQATHVGVADGVKIGLARRDAGRIRAARCRSSASRHAVAPDWGERHRLLMGREVD